MKGWWVMMEEVPLKELGKAELERLMRGWRRGAGSWFQKHTGRNGLLFVKKMMWMGERVWPKMKSECCEKAELWWYSRIKIDRNSVAASSLLRRWHQCAHQLIRLVCWVHASLPRTASQQVQPCSHFRAYGHGQQTDRQIQADHVMSTHL